MRVHFESWRSIALDLEGFESFKNNVLILISWVSKNGETNIFHWFNGFSEAEGSDSLRTAERSFLLSRITFLASIYENLATMLFSKNGETNIFHWFNGFSEVEGSDSLRTAEKSFLLSRITFLASIYENLAQTLFGLLEFEENSRPAISEEDMK